MAFASEDSKETLTLSDAIKMALDRNRDLKLQKLNIDKTSEELDDLSDTIEHIPATNVYIPEISRAWSGYLWARENERIAKKTFEGMKQQLVVDIKEQYYDVLESTRKIKLSETELRVLITKMSQARLKNRLGMLTQAELLSFETQLAANKSQLVADKNALDNSYTKLALLIGTSGVFQPELVDDVIFEKTEFISLDAVIARTLSQRYEVWAAERVAVVAERVKEHADNYNVGKIDSKIKEIEAGDVKDQMREQVKSLYLSLQNLEEANVTLEQKVAMLKEALRIVQVQHEVGMATALQVQEAEQDYHSAMDELRQLVYQHNLAKTQLQVLTGEDVLPEESK